MTSRKTKDAQLVAIWERADLDTDLDDKMEAVFKQHGGKFIYREFSIPDFEREMGFDVPAVLVEDCKIALKAVLEAAGKQQYRIRLGDRF
jgi:hypothetical protein